MRLPRHPEIGGVSRNTPAPPKMESWILLGMCQKKEESALFTRLLTLAELQNTATAYPAAGSSL
jgi:hypothetical protein